MNKHKNYSPVRIKNPTSMQHLVWLQPGQTLFLNLSKDSYPNPKIDLSTEHLLQLSCDNEASNKNGEKEYLISQAQEVSNWAEFSSCMLGDIWIDSDLTTARLVVMMASTNKNKKNFLTVVNPDCTDIRMKPSNILEVILHDVRFSDQDEWCWKWNSNYTDLELELIGYETMNLHMWYQFTDFSLQDPDYPYARYPRFDPGNNIECRQHHFWFRFTDSILDVMKTESGNKHAGNLCFSGVSDKFCKSACYLNDKFVSLNVDMNEENTRSFYKTLELKKFNDLSPSDSYKTSRPSVMTHMKRYVRQQYQPTLRDVKLKLLQSKSLDDGCNIIASDPEEFLSQINQFNYSDYNQFSEYGPQRALVPAWNKKSFVPHGLSQLPTDDDDQMYNWW